MQRSVCVFSPRFATGHSQLTSLAESKKELGRVFFGVYTSGSDDNDDVRRLAINNEIVHAEGRKNNEGTSLDGVRFIIFCPFFSLYA